MKWQDHMLARLRAARMDPPTTAAMRPTVDKAVRQAAMRVAAQGKTARVSVEAGRMTLVVRAEGPGANQVLAGARAEIRRRRPELRDAVRTEAQTKLRGLGR